MSVNRYNFWDIFENNPDGSLTAKQRLSINGVPIEPGFVLRSGVPAGGIDFNLYKDFDVAAEEVNDILEIKGFFRKQ